MKRLDRYILRQVFIPFAAGTIILLMMLSLERLLRLIEEVSIYNAPASELAGLMVYLMPHYLGLSLPAALFIGVFLAVRSLYDNSEIAVMRAAGIPKDHLLKPIMLFSLIMTLVLLSIVWWSQPHSRYAYRHSLHDIKTESTIGKITAGKFEEFGADMVIRAERYDSVTDTMHGFFAALTGSSGSKTFITSETARISGIGQAFKDQALAFHLQNGRMIKTGANIAGNNKEILPLTFQEYTWKPDIEATKPFHRRGTDERELTLSELAQGGVAGVTLESGPSETAAEFHARIVQAASLPFLALLAIPLAFIGSGRTGRASGLVLGVVILVGYEKLLGLSENLTESAPPEQAGLYIWSALALLVCLSSLFYARFSEIFPYILSGGRGSHRAQRRRKN